MNRRDFFRGLLATTAIIPTVSTKTIVDMAANTWRPTPAALGCSTFPTPGEFYRLPPGTLTPFLGLDAHGLWATIRAYEESRILEAT